MCKPCQLFVGKWIVSDYYFGFYIFQISLRINMSEMNPRKVRFDLYISVQSYIIPLLDINDFDCNDIVHYHNSVTNHTTIKIQ